MTFIIIVNYVIYTYKCVNICQSIFWACNLKNNIYTGACVKFQILKTVVLLKVSAFNKQGKMM